jgi:hypothetical protein
MLVVHAAAYWWGLGLLFGNAARPAGMRALLVLGIGWFPPTFWILPTVWKDVGALSFGFLAFGLLTVAARRDRRWIFASLACGFYAGAVRTPGLLAMLPLLWMASRLWVRGGGSRGERRLLARSVAVFGGLVLAFAAGITVLSTVGVRQEPYRAAVPLWDLARMSLARGELLIPDFAIHTANFDLGRLRRISSPNSCNFRAPDGGHARDLDYHQLSSTDANRIIGHWLRAAWNHPGAYLEHRWRVTRRVFVEPTLLWAHSIRPSRHDQRRTPHVLPPVALRAARSGGLGSEPVHRG